jgi:hypothetical protein
MISKIRKLLYGILLLSSPWRAWAVQTGPVTVDSPDGNIHLAVEAKGGKLTYVVSFKNTLNHGNDREWQQIRDRC